jgi:Outer membrane protein beta-barrel domain
LLKHLLSASCLFVFTTPVLLAQSEPTAKRLADLQVGGGFVIEKSDYLTSNLKGFAAYTTLDVTNHWGGEFVLHQAYSGTGDQSYHRTYEWGPRYHRDYGRFAPYVKAMYARAVFNYPNGVANLAYNMIAFGAGTDFKLMHTVNLRADYEYQDWLSFPPNGLHPQLITIGAAYHFNGDLRRGKHW